MLKREKEKIIRYIERFSFAKISQSRPIFKQEVHVFKLFSIIYYQVILATFSCIFLLLLLWYQILRKEQFFMEFSPKN